MMASRCYVPKNREFRGIQPSSVAIKARSPSKRPPNWLTLKNRAFEDNLLDKRAEVQEQQKQDLRTDFETSGEKRILIANIKNRVKILTAANESSLECRREKLQTLLASEEACLQKEFQEKEETLLERQAKMRERAKFLKDRREAERLAFVQDKYDQQFRSQCEELRGVLSKRHLEQITQDRLEQIRDKEDRALEKKAFENMYAKLWEQDMLEKAAREEREIKEQHERNRSTLEVLMKQMAALEAQKEVTKRLKDEEAQLLKEQRALWKMEDEKNLELKRQKQAKNREVLDQTLASKARKKAKEEQEMLAFDMKLLEQLMEESKTVEAAAIERKRQLRQEDQQYHEYLKKMMEEEKAREKELDRLIQQQTEEEWQKRMEVFRKRRMASKHLLDEVMEGRAQQLQERLMENKRKQIETAKERELLICLIEENKRLAAEEDATRLASNVQYQRDLIGQIGWNINKREEERASERDDFIKAQQTELEFQERKKMVLANPLVEKMHPTRRAILTQVQHY